MFLAPKLLLSSALLLALMPSFAAAPAGQNGHQRDSRDHQNFDQGLRDGGRGGQYYDQRHANDGYDQRYQRNQREYENRRDNKGDRGYGDQRGGIGPGKGALIGGAGGAVLGALFGGGLKGTIIGGAAGAGIGAVVGQANQSNRQSQDHRR